MTTDEEPDTKVPARKPRTVAQVTAEQLATLAESMDDVRYRLDCLEIDGVPGTVELTDEKSITVQAAIAQVMGRLPAIGKNQSAPGVPYKFRGIEDLTAAAQPIMAEVGLVIIPQAQTIVIDPSPGQKEAWQDVMVKFDWLIVGPDGSHLTASTFGIGRDHTDKGANKGQTQAFKYLLLALFIIADPKDDGDSHDYTDSAAEAATAMTPEDRAKLEKAALIKATYEAIKDLGERDREAMIAFRDEHQKALNEGALAADDEWHAMVQDKLMALEVARAQDLAAEGPVALLESELGATVVVDDMPDDDTPDDMEADHMHQFDPNAVCIVCGLIDA